MKPWQFVEDIKIADGELFIMEMQIGFDESSTVWAFEPRGEKKRNNLKYVSRLPAEIQELSDEEKMQVPLHEIFDVQKARLGLTGL